jgi:NADPH:quinone reductase-like Zn-dependent oxidoreductase
MKAASHLTAKIPDNITFDEAATIPTALIAATVALSDSSGLGFPSAFEDHTFGKGKPFLVLGGSSMLSLAGNLSFDGTLTPVIQLLRLLGFERIITTVTPRHAPLVKEFGATHIIDRTQSPATQVQQIRAIAPDLCYAWDPVGTKETNLLAAESIGPSGGHFVSALPVDEDILTQFPKVKGIEIVGNPLSHMETVAKTWNALEEALRTGEFVPLPEKVWPGGLGNVEEALKAVKKASGHKIVVHPQE